MSKISAFIKSNIGFYVGDICYVLSDDLYHGVWGDKYDFEDGEVTDSVSGLSFAVAGTAYGDGDYFGSDGRSYPVDAGVIGLVPLELVKKEITMDMNLVFSPGSASFKAEDGLFSIRLPGGSSFEIDTREKDDDEYEEEEEW